MPDIPETHEWRSCGCEYCAEIRFEHWREQGE
jgi:hypothetical protein